MKSGFKLIHLLDNFFLNNNLSQLAGCVSHSNLFREDKETKPAKTLVFEGEVYWSSMSVPKKKGSKVATVTFTELDKVTEGPGETELQSS